MVRAGARIGYRQGPVPDPPDPGTDVRGEHVNRFAIIGLLLGAVVVGLLVVLVVGLVVSPKTP